MKKEGAELFAEQLKQLDMDATVDEGWVEFPYKVEGGQFEGKSVQMAIKVPPDFPRTPPGGINFTPRLRPEHKGGQHPKRSHPSRRHDEGEYWSRPYPEWNREDSKSARTYMAYVRQLWDTT